ncbi:hypothetical protein MHU86_18408 [Fragilaria crotonensis]|nr:hypothetical protein MHU86_18408 [Fragilaria crotonensis]
MFLQSIVTLTVLLVAPFSVGAGGMDANRINFNNINNNMTIEDIRRNLKYLDPEKLELDREARMERQRTRREKARQKIASISPDISSMQRLSKEEWDKAAQEDHPWVRRAGWNSNSNYDPYSNAGLADPSQQYDKWQQAYRMLGGFIDCDHPKVSNNHKSGDNQQNQDADTVGCSRWMMWAAYVDPNYSGNGYDEYFGGNPSGVLDCHNPDSDWELIGVYRQEFYQYIEQISKHLWAIDEYEYVVALAGLSYMTKYECFQVGYSSDGQAIYAAVAPKAEARFEMALYTDAYCLTPNDNLGVTYDSFGLTTSMASPHKTRTARMEMEMEMRITMTVICIRGGRTLRSTPSLNSTTSMNPTSIAPRVDYPTYQDGYFIGDYGTDDDDLINQCWKFYSHNSYTCDADCISLGHAQGTILSVTYGGVVFGETPQSSTQLELPPLKSSPPLPVPTNRAGPACCPTSSSRLPLLSLSPPSWPLPWLVVRVTASGRPEDLVDCWIRLASPMETVSFDPARVRRAPSLARVVAVAADPRARPDDRRAARNARVVAPTSHPPRDPSRRGPRAAEDTLMIFKLRIGRIMRC